MHSVWLCPGGARSHGESGKEPFSARGPPTLDWDMHLPAKVALGWFLCLFLQFSILGPQSARPRYISNRKWVFDVPFLPQHVRLQLWKSPVLFTPPGKGIPPLAFTFWAQATHCCLPGMSAIVFKVAPSANSTLSTRHKHATTQLLPAPETCPVS